MGQGCREGMFPAEGRAPSKAQGRGHGPYEEVKVILGTGWSSRGGGE